MSDVHSFTCDCDVLVLYIALTFPLKDELGHLLYDRCDICLLQEVQITTSDNLGLKLRVPEALSTMVTPTCHLGNCTTGP